MLKEQFSPLIQQLVKLSDTSLSTSEKDILASIIEVLFDDIGAGNSCSRLSEISIRLELPDIELTAILQKSGLAIFYTSLVNLEAKPISYWETNDGVLVYISRYFAYEKSIAENILMLTNSLFKPDVNLKQKIFLQLDSLSSSIDKPNQAQLGAIKHSINNRFSIITGGPGTGKTTTVTLLLWALYQIYGNGIKVQVAAPTGKAAKRVSESITGSINRLSEHIDISCFGSLLANKENCSTIHKLLGTNNESIHFLHNKNNPLDVEILIIDESSMIGLPLFSKLLNALDHSKLKHIVFLGDKNQLSSVEEGYVFASLVDLNIKSINQNPIDLFDSYTEVSLASKLTVGKRNSETIDKLANAVLLSDISEVCDLLGQENIIQTLDLAQIVAKNLAQENSLANYMSFMQNISKLPKEDDIREIFIQFTQSINLCVTNTGVFGAENINQELERKIRQKYIIHESWYTGRAIIVLQNDYINDIFNGDIGICILDSNDRPRIYFANGRSYIPELLPKFALAYAITIHKSQGSEYKSVNIVIPNIGDSDHLASLLNKNLIYTAITRAEKSLTIFASISTVLEASHHLVSRNSGLANLITFNS